MVTISFKLTFSYSKFNFCKTNNGALIRLYVCMHYRISVHLKACSYVLNQTMQYIQLCMFKGKSSFLTNYAPKDTRVTFNVVVNDSVTVFVGEPVITPEDIRVTIDCGQLIDDVVNTTNVANSPVTWYKDGAVLTTGSAINVEISDDSRFCVITNTLAAIGGQLGTEGNYFCEVCSTPTQCEISDTSATVCSK